MLPECSIKGGHSSREEVLMSSENTVNNESTGNQPRERMTGTSPPYSPSMRVIENSESVEHAEEQRSLQIISIFRSSLKRINI